VEDLYHRAEAHGTAGEGSAGRHVKSRVDLAAVDADQLGPLALPLRLPARLRSPKALAKAKAAAVSLAAAEGQDEEQPRKHYSQQQMQMGGFPPEAWERPALNGNDAQGANGGNGGGNGKGGGNGQRQQPSGPFRIDNELNILPHETPDPPELFAHFYGYFGKSMATANFDFRREMKKIGQKVDRSEWFMSPQTVNAYYSPAWNEMVFPVAILQPPFFFKNFHPAMNFGSIGAIMGHEMTHGFDVSGRKFDKDGNEVDWWEPEALEEFLERAQCVADFYSNYTEYGVHLNGEAECGENIADMGGVKFAFRGMQAYMKTAKQQGKTFPELPRGLTPEQLYFVSYGQTWCTKSDQEYLLMLNAQDEHSLPRERVNGPLTNSVDFHTAFSCKLGTPMNPAPETKQCRMW